MKKKEKILKQVQDDKEKGYELSVGLKDLLAAGCHLGHKVAKTNPKARVNIYAAKDGIQVFDLVKSLEALKKACVFLNQAKKSGKRMVMVGTKRQAKEIVRRIAKETGVPYVTNRWLGGLLTNWDQVRKTLKRLTEIKDGLEKNKFSNLSKKDLSLLNKDMVRMERAVGGLIGADQIFEVLVAVDAGFEKTAIREAKMRGLTTVALVDTDSDPTKVDYPIPVNDDNIKSIGIIMEEIGKALK